MAQAKSCCVYVKPKKLWRINLLSPRNVDLVLNELDLFNMILQKVEQNFHQVYKV